MPKRIKVELEFIPVEERLPEIGKGVVGLLILPPGPYEDHKEILIEADGSLAYYGTSKGWLFNDDTPIPEYFITDLWELTHWAEIPKVETE